MNKTELKEVLEEKEAKVRIPLRLQFFGSAEDGSGNDGENVNDDESNNDDDGNDDSNDDGSNAKGEGGSKSGNNKGGKSNVKTFTQEEVTRMMTREKNQGRMAALKDLGIDPKDSKAVAMVKAVLDSQKSDEQKNAEKNAEDQQKIKEAEDRAVKAEAKAEAMLLGVKPQFVEDVVALTLSKLSDDSDVKTLIGEFKTKYPMWFGVEEDDDKDGTKKKGQKGTGSSVKANANKKGKSEEEGLGARLAAQRKSTTKKSSFWS